MMPFAKWRSEDGWILEVHLHLQYLKLRTVHDSVTGLHKNLHYYAFGDGGGGLLICLRCWYVVFFDLALSVVASLGNLCVGSLFLLKFALCQFAEGILLVCRRTPFVLRVFYGLLLGTVTSDLFTAASGNVWLDREERKSFSLEMEYLPNSRI